MDNQVSAKDLLEAFDECWLEWNAENGEPEMRRFIKILEEHPTAIIYVGGEP